MYSTWWQGKREVVKVCESKFSEECCHILNTVWTLSCPADKCISEPGLLFCFILFLPLYAKTYSDDQSWRVSFCYVSKSLLIIRYPKYGRTTARSTLSSHRNNNKDTQVKQALVFSKSKKCKKSTEFKGQKLSQKVIARIQILKTVIELHLYKD